MANRIWRGDAVPVAQVTKVTPSNPEAGDTFTLTINGKDIEVEAPSTSVSALVDALVEAINASTIPEFTEVTAAAADDGSYLTLTADTAGVPFEVSASAADAGGFDVDVTTITAGVAPTNEKQVVRIPTATSGGTFTLTFAGQTTGNIAYNAAAADIETALEALSNIASGDVTVTGSSPAWTVEFAGAYVGTNVPVMSGNGTNLTGAATITVRTTTEGSPGTNQITAYLFHNNEFTGTWGPWYFQEGALRGTSRYDTPSISTIQAAIEEVYGAGCCIVHEVDSDPDADDYEYDLANANLVARVEFVAHKGAQAIFLDLVDNSGGTTSHSLQTGSASGASEVQTVAVNDGPTAGTFTLTFQGQTTAGIAYNAAASAVQSALEALSNIGAGNVAVSLSGSTYTVTFQGTLAETDVEQMTASAASLTGGNVYVTTTQSAVAGTNEAQLIEFSQTPSGGTFTLTFNGETTGAIAYNASASTVQTALEGLATPVPGDFEVTGDDGGPWTVEFTGNYATTNVSAITGDGSSLTGSGSQSIAVLTTTDSAGPNHWDDPDNWVGGAVPVNGDDVFIYDGDVSILYGLDQSAVTLASLTIDSRYTGDVGLPVHNENDYYEYRDQYLAIGATTVVIGKGPGSGSGRIKLDTGAVQTTITVHSSGGSTEPGMPALIWKGTHASNALVIHDGDMGVAILPTETANLSGGLTQHGGTLQLGTVTITGDIEKTGGTLEADALTLTGSVQILA